MSGGTNAISALRHGDIDMADLGTADVINAIGAGVDVRAIMVASTVPEYLLVARPPHDTLAKLKGARVGIFGGSSVATELIKLSLRPARLGLRDMKTRTLGDSTTRAAALASGRIDATMLEYGDYLRLAAKVPGLKVLRTARDLFPVLNTPVFAVSGSYARSHPELLRRVVRGLADGYRKLYGPRGRPAFVAEAKKAHIDEKPSIVTRTYDYYRRIGIWPRDLRRVTPAIYDRALRFYLDGKQIEKPVPFDKVWDLSYWRAAG